MSSSQTARSAVRPVSVRASRGGGHSGALWACLFLGWLGIVPPVPMAWTLPGLALATAGIVLGLRRILRKRYLGGVAATLCGLATIFLAYIVHFAIVAYLAERVTGA